MNTNIHTSWKRVLKEEFEKPYFKELSHFVDKAYAQSECFPPKNQVFLAFDACPFDQVKVVVIGQDPYHDVNQAHGLCFSVNAGVSHPPSLKNIFKELKEDLGIAIPKSGNLEHLAKQGVLLLNATLTVKAHEAGSHQKKGWEQFTDAVIETISESREGVVFLLWGRFAIKKGRKIDRKKHIILETGHPSPLSANRGYWFGNKHFSKTNAYLNSNGSKVIKW
jgi:uracil-DNA glycosylase|tara:strand:+ start:56442 stop:57107 length:666 start_codon:yes stop_codon:yes gene_type:complete